MNTDNTIWKYRIYHAAFIFLTFLCWTPVLYGNYGPVGLFFSMPSWAALALGFGAILFVLQLIYLFFSGLALSDDNLAEIVDELQSADSK